MPRQPYYTRKFPPARVTRYYGKVPRFLLELRPPLEKQQPAVMLHVIICWPICSNGTLHLEHFGLAAPFHCLSNRCCLLGKDTQATHSFRMSADTDTRNLSGMLGLVSRRSYPLAGNPVIERHCRKVRPFHFYDCFSMCHRLWVLDCFGSPLLACLHVCMFGGFLSR